MIHCRFFLLLFFISSSTYAQNGNDIIQKHVKAMGGEANWQKIKTMTILGKIEDHGNEIEYKKQLIVGKSFRTNIKYISRNLNHLGETFYTIIHENKGWKYYPDNQNNIPIALEKNEVEMQQDELYFFDPFINTEKTGVKITFLTTEYYLDANHYKFLVQYKSGKQYYLYLNDENYLIEKRILISNDIESSTEYSHYKQLPQGIYYPLKIISEAGELNIKNVTINDTIPMNTFNPSSRNMYNKW